MQPDDLYELSWVSDPRLSPDGRTAAFVFWQIDRDANDYLAAIWLVPVDRSSPARQFTAGAKQDLSPRWSPDGHRLAFVSNREREANQLYVIPAAGGEAQRLTDLDEEVTEPVWSPDGTRLAFSARVRDPEYGENDVRRRQPRRFTRLQYKLDSVGWTGDRPRHVFVVLADGSSAAIQLTHGAYEHQSPAWSPDGRRIAFAAARQDDWDIELARDLFLVDADAGEPVRLTGCDAWHEAPVWSPDGSLIACRLTKGGFDYPRHGQIAVVDPANGATRVLTASLDRNCAPQPDIREPVWDGDSILFVLEDGGHNRLYRVPVDDLGVPELVMHADWVTGFDCAVGQIVHTATAPTCPAELFCGERRLTDVTQPFRAARLFSEPERFTASSADGTAVDAWMMRPIGFETGRQYPVLLNIHGGPFSQYGEKFLDEFQVFAGAGYVVLYSNPRGSSGYGEEWGRAIRGPVEGGPGWGTVDYEDLIAVTEEALRRFDFCDPGRVGVLGGSYGGYMTSWIIASTNRFRAACSERAVNNFVLEGGASDIAFSFKSYVGAHWYEAPDQFFRMSPASRAANITTPLLILHSEDDLRCPIGNAEDLFMILRLLRREVELVRFPGESHELSRSGSPAHRVMRFETILDWFARYLKAGEATPADAATTGDRGSGG